MLNHERDHVIVFQSTLNEYIPRLRRTFEQIAASIDPILSRDRKTAGERIRREIQDEVRDLLSEISDTLDDRNARLDSIDEYRRLQSQCSTW